MTSRIKAAISVAASFSLAGALVVIPLVSSASAQGPGRSALYGGIYSGGQPEIDNLRASGFTTVILWTMHVDRSTGDLVYNDNRLISNGQYVGKADWPAQVKSLKQAPTSVQRVEVTVGSAGVDDWGAIDALTAAQGTGTGSVLYRNFAMLKQVTGADAINNDDESHYDVASAARFSSMAASQGYAITLAPYTNKSYWSGLKNALGGAVDRAYLQAYAGGTGNDPADWASALGMPVDPGMWSRHGGGCAEGSTPGEVRAQMASWKARAGIPGGFMWLYDDMKACPGQGTARDYSSAINETTGS
jgi:hypothetical protein